MGHPGVLLTAPLSDRHAPLARTGENVPEVPDPRGGRLPPGRRCYNRPLIIATLAMSLPFIIGYVVQAETSGGVDGYVFAALFGLAAWRVAGAYVKIDGDVLVVRSMWRTRRVRTADLDRLELRMHMRFHRAVLFTSEGRRVPALAAIWSERPTSVFARLLREAEFHTGAPQTLPDWTRPIA